MEFIIVTGMSGAGKSKVIDALEDIGFFCVDNVPPMILPKFAELHTLSGGTIPRIAVVVDARGRAMFRDFLAALDALPIGYRLLFLDAADDVLLHRFKEGRRRHPLLGEDAASINEAIAQERMLLESAKARAHYVLDTSCTAASQLKERIVSMFMVDDREAMPIHCLSFGFKNGLPGEADLVFDVRCLPNPFYEEALREHTGLEAPVRDFVMNCPQSKELLKKLLELVDFLVPLYLQEGKSQLVIAVGCTGGKHRSVAFAQAIGEHLLEQNIHTIITHRDMKKQNHGAQ